MSKFDLRKYLPLLGIMGYLDNTAQKQAELNNEILKLAEEIDNLKFEVSIECKNEEKYNEILNELVEKYGAENKNNLGIIEDELEKIFQRDIEKFLKAWNYLLIKYKQYINEYEYIELSLVDSILRYISRYDEDRKKQINSYKFIKENEDIQEIVFENKYVWENTTSETLSTILYEIKDYRMFTEFFEIVYKNREKYVKFNFNEMLKDIITSRYYKQTSEGLEVLKEKIEGKEISAEVYKLLEQKEIEVLEDEKIEREYFGEEENIRKFEYATVVGIYYEDRIEVVKKLTIGEEIFFVREKDNQYDSNAIKVVNKNNETIGYVTKEKAQEIAPKLDAGNKYKCYINGIYEKKIKVEIHYEN